MNLSVGQERKIFEQDVPCEFLVATIECLLETYIEAHAHCKQRHGIPEFRYLFPHEQRANFEGDWRRLAKSYPAGKVSVRKNGKGDSHTRYKFGRIVMTQSAVLDPGDVPRHADFRATLAGLQQGNLFPSEEDEGIDADACLYAILTHGPRRVKGPLPAFIRIGFPDQECTHFVDYLDLTPLLQDILSPPVEPIEPTPVEEQPGDLVLRLRAALLKGKKEG